MFTHAPRLRTRRNRLLSGGIECLERRDMLSGSPPTVTKVEVSSTSWSSAFVQYLKTANLGTNGYSIPTGSSSQSASLTWKNINQVSITFSEDVQVDAADLSLSGINHATYSFGAFHYDPQARVATWTLSSYLDKDRYRIDLDTNGANPVRDLDGNVLDGDWTNNSSTVSGNGTAGGDFQFNFNVLPTDVNNTGNITTYDYTYIRQLDGKSTSSSGYIAGRDINGDSVINSTDWQEALNRMGQSLPGGNPAGTNNDAPTTQGFSLVQITDSDIDVAISLLSGFRDAESGSSGLTYSILSNNNPSLFDTAAINSSTQELTLNAASGASGRATLNVRGMDPGGLYVDTTITVDVNYQNQAPQISNLTLSDVGTQTWVISGDVSDPDDDVSNFIVSFYGAINTRSAVDSNGHFVFSMVVDENTDGPVWAVTTDPHGAQSNTPFGEIYMT